MKKTVKIIINNMNTSCLRNLATTLNNNGFNSVIIEGDNGNKTVSLFLRAFGFTEVDPADVKDKVESVIIDNNGFHFKDSAAPITPIQGNAPVPEVTVSTVVASAPIPANNAVAKSDVVTHLTFEMNTLAKELREEVKKEVETSKNIAEPTPATIRAGKKFIFIHCSTDGVNNEDLLLKSLTNKAKDPNVVFTAIVGTWAEKVLEKSGLRLRKIYPDFKSFKKSKAFANALNEAWNSASASVFFAKSEAEAKQGKDIAFKAVSKRYNSNAKTTFVVFQDDKKWFLFK